MTFLSPILDILFPPRESELIIRSHARHSPANIYKPSIQQLEHIEIGCLASYKNSIIESLIIEAKFHANLKAHKVLGTLLAHHIKESFLLDEQIYLVPVPLSAIRLKERGYNQVEEVARYAVESLFQSNIPIKVCSDVLERVRDTKPQTSLNRKERLRNIVGAFKAVGPIDRSKTYIVVDDVLTTGATLFAAATALLDGGATRVHLLALAH